MNRPNVRLRKGPDGRWQVYCRICDKRRAWQMLAPNERVNGWFDTEQDAEEQGRRHRQSRWHQQVVLASAGITIVDNGNVLNGGLLPAPDRCANCGYNHAEWLDCARAAQIRIANQKDDE